MSLNESIEKSQKDLKLLYVFIDSPVKSRTKRAKELISKSPVNSTDYHYLELSHTSVDAYTILQLIPFVGLPVLACLAPPPKFRAENFETEFNIKTSEIPSLNSTADFIEVLSSKNKSAFELTEYQHKKLGSRAPMQVIGCKHYRQLSETTIESFTTSMIRIGSKVMFGRIRANDPAREMAMEALSQQGRDDVDIDWEAEEQRQLDAALDASRREVETQQYGDEWTNMSLDERARRAREAHSGKLSTPSDFAETEPTSESYLANDNLVSVPDEPQDGVQIRISGPDIRVIRRFNPDNTIAELFSYLASVGQSPDVTLVSRIPALRITLLANKDQTIAEAFNNINRISLFIE